MRNPRISDRQFQGIKVYPDGRLIGYSCLAILGFILIVSLFTKPDMENKPLDPEQVVRRANLQYELTLEELSIIVLTPGATDQLFDEKTRKKIRSLYKFGYVSNLPWEDAWSTNCIGISGDPETAIGRMNSWVKAGKTGLYPCTDGIQGALLKFVYTKDRSIFFGGNYLRSPGSTQYETYAVWHVDIKLVGLQDKDILWGGEIIVLDDKVRFLPNSGSYDPNRTTRYDGNELYFEELASFKEKARELFGKPEVVLSK